MLASPRRALLLSWVLLTFLTSVLPPWDLCWHRDGALCAEIERSACCGDESAPSPKDDSCSDCTDYAATPALRLEVDHAARGLTAHVPPAALPPTATLLLFDPTLSARLSSSAPVDPGPPRAHTTRPLRC